jgi:tRNA(Ile)-lysidine synthetase-like protein
MDHTIHKYSYNTISDCVGKLPESFFDEKVLMFLQEQILSWKKLWIAFSWGPDSVFLILHIQYILLKNRNKYTKNIIVLHYVHHVRDDDNKDIFFMQENIFQFFSFAIAWYLWVDTRESVLREVRWDWLNEMCWLFRLDSIVTWHNMTDRIETTLLNAIRGSSNKWWNWMSSINKRLYGEVNRPLLHISKQDITKKLDTYCCPYIVDPTNNDTTISERNRVRTILFSKAWWTWIYNIDRRNSFYGYLENWIIVTPVSYIQCAVAPSRGSWILWRLDVKKTTLLEEVIGVGSNNLVVDNSNSTQRKAFASWSSLWYFKIWKDWILRTSWMFYYTTLWKDFWVSTSRVVPIELFWLDRSIRRLPENNDIYEWKAINDWLKWKSVPVFRRNCLPVQWETPIIKKIYPLDDILW